MKKSLLAAAIAIALASATPLALADSISTGTGGAGGSGGSAAGGAATGGTATNSNNTSGVSNASGGVGQGGGGGSASGGSSSSSAVGGNVGTVSTGASSASTGGSTASLGDVTVNYNVPGGPLGKDGLGVGVDPVTGHVVTDNKVTYSGGYKLKNTPDVSLGGPASGPCNGFSGGLGVSVPGIAFGANASTVDEGCAARETARVAAMLGRMDIANAVLESMPVVAAAMKAKAMREAAAEPQITPAPVPASIVPTPVSQAQLAQAQARQAQMQAQQAQAQAQQAQQALREQQRLAQEALARQATMNKLNDTLKFSDAKTQGDEKTPQQIMAEEASKQQAAQEMAKRQAVQAAQEAANKQAMQQREAAAKPPTQAATEPAKAPQSPPAGLLQAQAPQPLPAAEAVILAPASMPQVIEARPVALKQSSGEHATQPALSRTKALEALALPEAKGDANEAEQSTKEIVAKTNGSLPVTDTLAGAKDKASPRAVPKPLPEKPAVAPPPEIKADAGQARDNAMVAVAATPTIKEPLEKRLNADRAGTQTSITDDTAAAVAAVAPSAYARENVNAEGREAVTGGEFLRVSAQQSAAHKESNSPTHRSTDGPTEQPTQASVPKATVEEPKRTEKRCTGSLLALNLRCAPLL